MFRLDAEQERTRKLLITAALVGLAVGVHATLSMFITPLAWAIILVLATWPLHRRLLSWMPRAPNTAAVFMTLALALGIILPVGPLIVTGAKEARTVVERFESWINTEKPELPDAVKALPGVGPYAQAWFLDQREKVKDTGKLLEPYRRDLLSLIGDVSGRIVSGVFNVIVCLVSAFFLYRDGESAALQVRRAAIRIGGSRLDGILRTTRLTVRGAVYGMIMTAIVQGVLAGIGYFVAETPVPLLLGFVTILASFIPLGPPFVYLPAAALIVLNGAPWWHGALLAGWGIGVVSTADNIIRPIFISQATKIPGLLVFFAVFGGIAAFGMIGLFVGPVIMAIAQVLWLEWASPDTDLATPLPLA